MIQDDKGFAAEPIPASYASWRYCIEVKCGIPLTLPYVRERIAVLGNADCEEAQRFARTYGPTHLSQVLAWFRQAEAALGGGDAAPNR